jgi:hypothetical protein
LDVLERKEKRENAESKKEILENTDSGKHRFWKTWNRIKDYKESDVGETCSQ